MYGLYRNAGAVRGARSAKGADIADQVVDFAARQRQIRHCAVRVRQKGAKLIGGQPAARDCSKARRTLRYSSGRILADHVAARAPLTSELPAFAGVGAGGVRADKGHCHE